MKSGVCAVYHRRSHRVATKAIRRSINPIACWWWSHHFKHVRRFYWLKKKWDFSPRKIGGRNGDGKKWNFLCFKHPSRRTVCYHHYYYYYYFCWCFVVVVFSMNKQSSGKWKDTFSVLHWISISFHSIFLQRCTGAAHSGLCPIVSIWIDL